MINAEIECKKSLSPLSRKCYLNREWPQKYKAVIFFPCRKIEIKRTTTNLLILFIRMKFLPIFEAKSWTERITNV
jgi:hypothetical protein